MNRRICRQVLDCGDGVHEVTALALAGFKISKRVADTAATSAEKRRLRRLRRRSPTRSRANSRRTRFMVPMHAKSERRLSINARQEMLSALEALDESELEEVAHFVRFLKFRRRIQAFATKLNDDPLRRCQSPWKWIRNWEAISK
jgi:hypothetical protein